MTYHNGTGHKSSISMHGRTGDLPRYMYNDNRWAMTTTQSDIVSQARPSQTRRTTVPDMPEESYIIIPRADLGFSYGGGGAQISMCTNCEQPGSKARCGLRTLKALGL